MFHLVCLGYSVSGTRLSCPAPSPQKTYVTFQILCIPWIWSKVREKVYEMSKYENHVLLYSLHCTVNLPAWKPKDTNITLMSFLRLFTETITPEKDFFFFIKFYDKCCQNWWNLSGTVNSPFCDAITKIGTCNLSFCNILLKYEPRIKDKEPHHDEQKIYTNFFYFTLHLKFFHKFLSKEIRKKIIQNK